MQENAIDVVEQWNQRVGFYTADKLDACVNHFCARDLSNTPYRVCVVSTAVIQATTQNCCPYVAVEQEEEEVSALTLLMCGLRPLQKWRAPAHDSAFGARSRGRLNGD